MHLTWNNPIFELLCSYKIVYPHPFASIPARKPPSMFIRWCKLYNNNIWLFYFPALPCTSNDLCTFKWHDYDLQTLQLYWHSSNPIYFQHQVPMCSDPYGSYFPMGFPDQEKPHSMSFSLCRNRYASISFPLKRRIIRQKTSSNVILYESNNTTPQSI